jgi:hypothetical protein
MNNSLDRLVQRAVTGALLTLAVSLVALAVRLA